MKILVVVHRFVPRHQTGAELYTYRLARELAREHSVVIFTADDDLMHRNYSRRVFPLKNLRVIQVTNHRKHSEFAHSYADPRMEKQFRDVIRAEEPDLVHFQHVLHHSVDYPRIAREHGVPSVLTLHEYWLLCARNGQLIQADGTRCLGPALDKCSHCMSHFTWGRRGFEVWILRGIESVKKLTGVDLKAKARELRLRRFDDASSDLSEDVGNAMKRDLLFREARVRDMFDMVDCFVAPSAFLRDRFIDFGLDGERILLSDYGTVVEDFVAVERVPRGDKVRLGFVGSVQPVKGVHLVLQALQGLDPSKFEAVIYGDMDTRPEYVRTLSRQLSESVKLMGKVDAEDIPEVMGGLDVLIVPSLWWENSPLVIHEAFAAKVPVVCSAIGGMAELVEHGVSGLHFAPDDASDLAQKLGELIENPDGIERLSRGIPDLKDMKADAEFHASLFEAVIVHHAESSENSETEF